MKILVSTFGEGDDLKILEAMRCVPFEKLVLIGREDTRRSKSFAKVAAIEELSGHEATLAIVEENDFMKLVDEISSILERCSRDQAKGARWEIVMNISGGSKLLGDAALFAAFRLGIEACHCDQRYTKLPVIKGATAIDRFTPNQVRFIGLIDDSSAFLDDVALKLGSESRQSIERVLRELRKLGLLRTEVSGGKIRVALSDAGREVSRALKR